MKRMEVNSDSRQRSKVALGHTALLFVICTLGFATAAMATDLSDSNPPPDSALSASSAENEAGSGGQARLRDRFSELSYADELPPELSLEEFESTLQTQFYGTYVFYAKLSPQKRLTIYQGYRNEQHIAAIRASTLELLR
jgi:hypothetical protein